ncbi:hypothetical protein L0F63_001221 [Massospora cicadina]|nr:hypothetical protein L0F63_001221 [Massospora cicadina]
MMQFNGLYPEPTDLLPNSGDETSFELVDLSTTLDNLGEVERTRVIELSSGSDGVDVGLGEVDCIILSSDLESDGVSSHLKLRHFTVTAIAASGLEPGSLQVVKVELGLGPEARALGIQSNFSRGAAEGVEKRTGSLTWKPRLKPKVGSALTRADPHPLDIEALTHLTARQFRKEREAVAKRVFEDINARALDGILPQTVGIIWAKTLNKTAGQFCGTQDRVGVRSGHIKLATKVLDDFPKLFSTLAHEMCHAADFLTSTTQKLKHGPSWKAWAAKVCSHYPSLKISTRHSYEIFYKHWYRCINPTCATM